MPDRVRITDVSPRDGLQNEPGFVPTADKVRLIELLCKTGVDEIEVTSFVSPKWVPQLGDAEEVARQFMATRRGVAAPYPVLSFLVPNEQGMIHAERMNTSVMAVDKIAVFTSASESFCRKNVNASISETLERFRPVLDRALHMCGGSILVRGYISCAIACPFEGAIPPSTVAQVARQLADLGVHEIDLGDTIGAGTPPTVARVIRAVMETLGPDWLGERFADAGAPLTLHLHDTFGRAADCVKAALDMGVRSFDGSVAGLGGCPYASTPGKRAPGNISTETLVRTIHEAGYETGVDLARLEEAAAFARQIVAKSRAAGASA